MHAVKASFLEDCEILTLCEIRVFHLVEGESSQRNNARKYELGGQRGRLVKSQDFL